MYLIPLFNLRPTDREVGVKARSLGRLARVGLPVPPGIVLRHSAFLAYLQAHNATGAWRAFVARPNEAHAAALRTLLASVALPAEVLAALQRDIAAKLCLPPTIQATEPACYAVRSAFGGINGARYACTDAFDSLLGVASDGLDVAVRTVWASAFSQSALVAAQTAGPVRTMSLLVQAIPPLDCAGVLLTRPPEHSDALLVASVWGLAQPLVQGRVRPDRWLLAGDGRLLRHEPGERRSAVWPANGGVVERPLEARAPAPLLPERLADLRTLALRTEHVLGEPQYIEWLHDGQRFWLVQARPITVVNHSQVTIWTAANVHGLYPDPPSPLALSIMLGSQQQAFAAYTALEPRLAGRSFISAFKGRPYLNLSLLVDLVTGWGLPASVATDAVGADLTGTTLDRVEYQRLRPLRLLAALPTLLRLQFRHLLVAPRARRTIAWLRRQERRLAKLPAPLPDASLPDVVALHSTSWRRAVAESLHVTGALSIPLFLLRYLVPAHEHAALIAACRSSTQLARNLAECAALAQQALEAHPNNLAACSPADLKGLLEHESPFQRRCADLLAKHGHRGMYESDIASPRFSEQPEVLLEAIARLVEAAPAPPDLTRQNSLARVLLTAAQRLFVLHEQLHAARMRVLAQLRRHDLALGRHWVAEGLLDAPTDLFWLTLDELNAASANSQNRTVMREIVTARKAQRNNEQTYRLPAIFAEHEIEQVDDLVAYC